jgi:hypothetical protein
LPGNIRHGGLRPPSIEVAWCEFLIFSESLTADRAFIGIR